MSKHTWPAWPDWGFVIRGTARQPALVWVIEVDGNKVRYEAPNPWALREGDKRAGWTKPQTADAKDLVFVGNTELALAARYIAAIGLPPSTRRTYVPEGVDRS